MKQNSRVFGGTLIVAGTAIGAGMLALPMLSAGIGFFYSIALMTCMWLVSLFSALVTVEIILYSGKNSSIPYLSGKIIGRSFKIIGALSLTVLLYSVLSAYISGLSSIINKNLISINLGESYISMIVAIVVAYVLFLSISVVDYTNRVLFIGKMILFVFVVMTFIPYVKSDNFFTQHSVDNMPEIILVFFTSFGFQGSIPTVMKYVGNDIKSLRKVFIFGSAIPLVTYILWQGITLGVLPFEGEHSFVNALSQGKSVGAFINGLSAVTQSGALSIMLDVFSMLAMITSILGVAIGLFDYILENLKFKINSYTKIKAIVLTLGIPLIFSVYYPSGFILALNFAAIALVILAIILPGLIALKTRSNYGPRQYKVAGGNFMIHVFIAAGIFLIVLRIYQLL